jgi:glutamine synthetase
MHCHQSLFDLDGNNLFFDASNEFKLSPLAYSFIAGQLKHARALAGVVAPTVNSYKRLVPGYEAPVYIGWAQINRSALIRIPRYTEGMHKATRAELRFPDPSANPYLAFNAMLTAALDGIDNKLTPPTPLNNLNVYELTPAERAERGVGELPGSLYEALMALDADEVVKGAFDPALYEAYMRGKMAEWDEYRIHVTDWEVERFLESA